MAITASDFTRISDSLNIVYEKTKTGNFFSPDTDAFLAYCEDHEDNSNGGKSFSVKVVGDGDVTSSAEYLSAGGRAVYNEFLIPAATEHWRAQWTLDAMLAANTKGTDGAFDLAKETIDIHQAAAKRRFGINLGGKGWGSLAGIQARTTGASGTITLGMPDGTSSTAVPELARRFYVGQKLYAADAEDSGAMRGTQVTLATSDAVATITSINYDTGVLTCDTVPASFAVGDYIGQQGNRFYNTTTYPTRRLVVGLEAWLSPEVVTGALGGVTLTSRPDLQPIRTSASGKSIKDGLIDADVFHFTQGKPREGLAIFTTPELLRTLAKNQEKTKVVEITRDEKGQVGKKVVISVSAFMLDGMGSQPIPVMASNFIRPKTAFLGPFMSKKYGFQLRYSGSKLINVNTYADGLVFRHVQGGVLDGNGETVPGMEAEGFIRAALVCRHPNNYLVITDLSE